MNRHRRAARRPGYTLVEMMVATALTLIMMYAVVSIFADIGDSVNDSRSNLEMGERLRAAVTRLGLDLAGVTAVLNPPCRVESNQGYFEIIEGANLSWETLEWLREQDSSLVVENYNIARDSDSSAAVPIDTTVGDFDDVLMFTARSADRPFRGRCSGASGQVVESDVAEICWFVRGNKLYRRVLLVAPAAPISDYTAAGFYAANDISVRHDGSSSVIPNTLADLTKRENRFAHHPTTFPFAANWGYFGLPTLGECSNTAWAAGNVTPVRLNLAASPNDYIDFWSRTPFSTCDPASGSVDAETGEWSAYAGGSRFAEDVILTNVIGFDVKVYDPDVGGYVDLGSDPAPGTAPDGRFYSTFGHSKSQLMGTIATARTYCTWSDHYERDAIDQNGDGVADAATNGFDDDGQFGVDDVGSVVYDSTNSQWVSISGERDTMPPYPFPLRGIQVKIRVFEPSTQQVRELTVVQDFLPK